ncbi:sugar ABC transporter ATP-binding protein [Pseudonocardia eucalypti]|uniref:Sugar ABC transporter ATP-binding protein n=1 Tax=Pseudonocardia eucalypti TaxID=648755 RepID=A0ABP9QNY5_9PSEU|nr:ribose transport system ATP-binding protein [Pseudonocardia eucalypti]
MTPPLLEVRGVRKEFPGVVALDEMHLDLNAGEVLAVVGENGAGKSTLMKILSGIYQPDAGEVRIDGEEVRVGDPKHALELGISIIHQEFNLIPDLTVAQNVFVGREPRRAGLFLDHGALVAMTRELLDRLHLPLDPNAQVGRLTVAQQQMVEIVKALSQDARVLIMDEPTAALNDAEVEVLHGLIRRFRAGGAGALGRAPSSAPDGNTAGGAGALGRAPSSAPDGNTDSGTGVIYISHRLEELKAISDRITVIRDGRFVDTLTTAEASLADVITRMVGRELPPAGAAATPEVPATGRPVLSVRGLSTKALLRDVGFDLHEGEILGFAGLMGAGRTEVARAVVGADPTTSGTIELHGRTVRIPDPATAARLGIGYLSEDRKQLGLIVEQTVAENIALSSLARSFQTAGFVRRRSIASRAASAIQDLRIKTPSLGALVRNLSGGNQQKVVIAKWLVRDCEVLIFDEPTRGIDVGAKEEIYRLVRELAARGKAIIVISSELPEVLRLSHRVVVMSEGRVTGRLEAEDATQESIMHLATLRRSPEAGSP